MSSSRLDLDYSLWPEHARPRRGLAARKTIVGAFATGAVCAVAGLAVLSHLAGQPAARSVAIDTVAVADSAAQTPAPLAAAADDRFSAQITAAAVEAAARPAAAPVPVPRPQVRAAALDQADRAGSAPSNIEPQIDAADLSLVPEPRPRPQIKRSEPRRVARPNTPRQQQEAAAARQDQIWRSASQDTRYSQSRFFSPFSLIQPF